MRAEDIEKLIGRRPFRPIEISLENGERHRLTHPESIAMTPDWVMIQFRDGSITVFEAADITSVRFAPKNGPKK